MLLRIRVEYEPVESYPEYILGGLESRSKISAVGTVVRAGGGSGCGVWVASEAPGDLIWKAVPILAGVVHHHVKNLEVLIASRLSSIAKIIDESSEFATSAAESRSDGRRL